MNKQLSLFVILGLLTFISVAQAQGDAPAPLIAVSKGDIYTIDPTNGSIKQLTHHSAIEQVAAPTEQDQLAISPDGQYLAYLQLSRFYAVGMRDKLDTVIGPVPEDVVILNLTTGEEKQITQQQANLKVTDQYRFWLRGNLTWSSDNQLAYYQRRGEYPSANYVHQLMVYDPLIDKTFTLVGDQQLPDEMVWLSEGIASGANVWDTNGKVIAQHTLNKRVSFEHRSAYPSGDYAIVKSNLSQKLGHITLFDMETEQYLFAEGYQASVSALSPQNSLVFIWGYLDVAPIKVVNPQTGDSFKPGNDVPYLDDFTFSPDGQQFAYVVNPQSINISDLNGHEQVIPFKASTILWSAQAYTVTDENGKQDVSLNPTDEFKTETLCGTLAPVGLVKGGQGKVIVGGGANRIRSAPDPDAELLGQIPEGETFDVVDGQQDVCSQMILWAQVEYNGIVGWTAQGADGKAFLQPVQS